MGNGTAEAEMAAEQNLVARARTGEQAACRLLVERYENLVAATVTGMLGPGAEADDVGQETFIRFFGALNQYKGEGGVAPYLTRIAINLSLNALDKKKRRLRRFLSRDQENDLPEPAFDGEVEVQQSDWREVVQRAVRRLEPHHRAVVVLRLIDGYSTKETAELLGVPTGTVLSRLSRAQKELKTILGIYLKET